MEDTQPSGNCILVGSPCHYSLLEAHSLGAYHLQLNEGSLDPNWPDASPVTDALEYSALYYQVTLVVSSSSSVDFWQQHLEDPSDSCWDNQKQLPSCHQLCWMLVGHLLASMIQLRKTVLLAEGLDLQLTFEMHWNQNQITIQLSLPSRLDSSWGHHCHYGPLTHGQKTC